VLVEEAAVPAAHLVVRHHVGVLHVVLLEDLGRLDEQVVVDPRGHLPVLVGDQLVSALGLGGGLGLLLELGREWDVVEEGPRVVELVVPRLLEVAHGLQHAVELLVAHQGQQGGVDARGARGAGGVGFLGRVDEDALGFARGWRDIDVSARSSSKAAARGGGWVPLRSRLGSRSRGGDRESARRMDPADGLKICQMKKHHMKTAARARALTGRAMAMFAGST
jgi:hypothetical protein